MNLGTQLGTVLLVSIGLSNCTLLDTYVSRYDFESPKSALENAKQLNRELGRLISIPRDFEALKTNRRDRKAMAERMERVFEGTSFNGVELRFWEYSTGNLDSCDDGWQMSLHVIVAPRMDTKRKFLSRPAFGRYQIRDSGDAPALYASRSISLVDGKSHYEYCYDIEGISPHTWMRYFFVGESVRSAEQARDAKRD